MSSLDALSGASVMNRWRPAPNPCAWYSLRLISSTDVVLSSTRPTRSEKSELSQPRVSVAWKSRLRKHRSHGFYRTRSGKRRRYRCVECEKTFSSTKGTPYYRLQHRRATFDAVVALRVEGVSISAIARVRRDFLEHCRSLAREGSQSVSSIQPQKDIAGFAVEELQADEIRSFVGAKTRPTWIFVAIEVWSRLWPSTVTGRRNYRNTLALLRDVALVHKYR